MGLSLRRLDFREGGGVSAIAKSSALLEFPSSSSPMSFLDRLSLYSGLGGGVTAGRPSGDVETSGNRLVLETADE